MFKSFFDWLDHRRFEHHIWVRIPGVDHENELWHEHMPQLKTEICNAFNLIADNEHEGAGWWEKVEVVRTKNFGQLTLDKICSKEEHALKTSNFPRIADGSALRLYTYLPKEVLKDLEEATDRVIGFKPHKTQRGQPDTVVWIHLRKPESTR